MRSGEGGTALLLALNVFLLLTAYSVTRVLREPLIQASGGPEVRSYSAAGQALLLLVLVPAYGALAARVPRRNLIIAVTGFFIACMVGFYVLAKQRAPVGVPFFLWVGVFSLMVIAQFWSFANDVYTTEEGKRLFPLVMFGASVGAVTGSWLTGQLIRPFGLYEPLLLAAALLVIAATVTVVVDTRERRRTEAKAAALMTSGTLPAATAQFRHETGEFKAVTASETYAKASGQFKAVKPGMTPADEIKATRGGFGLVLHNPYLLSIALLMVVLNWVNTTGEYIMARTVRAAADAAVAAGTATSVDSFIGAYASAYQTGFNLLSLLLQLFVVSRVLKYFGVRIALFALPVIAFAGYALLAFAPVVLAMVRWAKTAENATDYSIQNTTRQALFLPTTREEKYSAKQAIDSFFVRGGDMLSAGLVYAGSHWLAMQTRHYAMVNLVLVAGWLALAVVIGRRYEKLAAAAAS